MNLKLIILLTILTATVTTTIAYTVALEADMINHTYNTYIPIITEFNYIIESSITKFKDYLGLIATFIITIHSEDYQLRKENDYVTLLAEIVYYTHDPTAFNLTTQNSNIDIASNMMIQRQESITINRYTLLSIQFVVNVYIEGDDR